ncbi:MAG: amidohydrolase [Sphingobium phenoxybenzoativorans]
MAFRLTRLALLACAGLAACAAPAAEGPKSANAKSSAAKENPSAEPDDPYPSTYQPYPGMPTVVRNVTIFDGEGGRIDNGVIFFVSGKISSIGGPDTPIPADIAVFDGTGKYLTPGIIDIHSHLGDYPSPSVDALSDGNEMTSPVTPDVWAEHSIWPQDPGFSRALVNGGVTALQILPGSGNLFGGRGVSLKNVYARTMQGMKFPGAPYSLKMACGENPKRVYGGRNTKPSTRMGNIAVDRATWIKARDYQKKRAAGKEQTRDLGMETLADVLEGKILVQNHCYRADEMANVIDMAKEFGYKVTAFHHAVESYKIADLLKENGICSAMWADWYGFKMESYDGIRENIALVHNAGACAIVHSDDENGIQRLNQEAAKAIAAGRRMGINIPDEIAWEWLSYNPAKAMGIGDKTGSLKVGKMADIVLWNGNPFSVYTRPEKVWIDGAMMYDANDPKKRPVSDFELGQIGAGDVK